MLKIGVTHGLRGWFAVLYDENGPLQTGIGGYKKRQSAENEAVDWARSENIDLDFTPDHSQPTSYYDDDW